MVILKNMNHIPPYTVNVMGQICARVFVRAGAAAQHDAEVYTAEQRHHQNEADVGKNRGGDTAH